MLLHDYTSPSVHGRGVFFFTRKLFLHGFLFNEHGLTRRFTEGFYTLFLFFDEHGLTRRYTEGFYTLFLFFDEHGRTRRYTETNMQRSLRSDTIRTIFFLYESHESDECLCTELTENTEDFKRRSLRMVSPSFSWREGVGGGRSFTFHLSPFTFYPSLFTFHFSPFLLWCLVWLLCISPPVCRGVQSHR